MKYAESGLSLLKKLCLQEAIKMGVCISNACFLALTSKTCACSSTAEYKST